MLIQNNLYSWIETTAWIVIEETLKTSFMIILEICLEDPFDTIAMTLRGTLGLCCVHISQLMTYLAIYTLASWHTTEGNKVKKFIEFCRVKRIIDQIMMIWKNVPTSNLLDIGLITSQRRSRVAEIFPLPIKYFEQRILRYD